MPNALNQMIAQGPQTPVQYQQNYDAGRSNALQMRGQEQQLANNQQVMQQNALSFQQKQQEATTEQMKGDVLGAWASAASAPPEQRQQVYQQVVTQLKARHGQRVAQIPDQYPGDDAFLSAGLQLFPKDAVEKIAQQHFAPNQKDQPNSVQEYRFAQQNGYKGSYQEWMQQNKSSGGSPYFPPVTTNQGIMVWDSRTGKFTPAIAGNGQPLLAPATDVNLQGDLARTKAQEGEIGKTVGGAQGAEQVKFVKAEDNAAILKEIRGLLPTATGSGAGRARDAAAGFFGYSTEGAEAAGQLDILAAKMVMQVPRLEGPQSDRDTQLYKEAAGQFANRDLPSGVRLKALELMERLNNEYLPGGVKYQARSAQQQPGAQPAAPQQPAGQPRVVDW